MALAALRYMSRIGAIACIGMVSRKGTCLLRHLVICVHFGIVFGLVPASEPASSVFQQIMAKTSWGSNSYDIPPPLPSMRRMRVDELYATGRQWFTTAETGIKHCAIQGTLSLKAMTMDGKKKGEEPKDKDFLLHLWTRVKSNATHWKVCRFSALLMPILAVTEPRLLVSFSRVANTNAPQVRGHGFFEPQPGGVRYRYIKMPHALMFQFATPIILEDTWTRKQYKLKVVRTTEKPPHHTFAEGMRTFHYEAIVPASDSYVLKLVDPRWKRGCFLSASQEEQRAPWLPLPTPMPQTAAGEAEAAAGGDVPAFVIVMRHPSGFSANVWANIYYEYARYHRFLGFAAMVVYLRDNYLTRFLREPLVQKALEERLLYIVRWDDIPAYPNDNLQVYDQHLVSQHGSLVHWDENTRVYHADADEFMALMDPAAGNLADLTLAGCLRNVTQAVFNPDDMGADECGGINELDCFVAESDKIKYHGMEHYKKTKEASASWPKVMLDPDHTFGHHVHDALDLPGWHYTKMDKRCMRVFHLQNMFRKRWAKDAYYDKMVVPVQSYQWVIEPSNRARLRQQNE